MKPEEEFLRACGRVVKQVADGREVLLHSLVAAFAAVDPDAVCRGAVVIEGRPVTAPRPGVLGHGRVVITSNQVMQPHQYLHNL